MDWMSGFFDEHGATLIEVLIGLIVLIVLIAIMDGSKRHQHDDEPPDSSNHP